MVHRHSMEYKSPGYTTCTRGRRNDIAASAETHDTVYEHRRVEQALNGEAQPAEEREGSVRTRILRRADVRRNAALTRLRAGHGCDRAGDAVNERYLSMARREHIEGLDVERRLVRFRILGRHTVLRREDREEQALARRCAMSRYARARLGNSG